MKSTLFDGAKWAPVSIEGASFGRTSLFFEGESLGYINAYSTGEYCWQVGPYKGETTNVNNAVYIVEALVRDVLYKRTVRRKKATYQTYAPPETKERCAVDLEESATNTERNETSSRFANLDM